MGSTGTETWKHVIIHDDDNLPTNRRKDDADFYLAVADKVESTCRTALYEMQSKWTVKKCKFDPSHVRTFRKLGRRVGHLWFYRGAVVVRASIFVRPATAELPFNPTVHSLYVALPFDDSIMHSYLANKANITEMVRMRLGRLDERPRGGRKMIVQKLQGFRTTSNQLEELSGDLDTPKVTFGSFDTVESLKGDLESSLESDSCAIL